MNKVLDAFRGAAVLGAILSLVAFAAGFVSLSDHLLHTTGIIAVVWIVLGIVWLISRNHPTV